MKAFRDDLLGLYVAEDESKTMKIERADDAAFPFRVSVWRGLGEDVHVTARPAKWSAPEADKNQTFAWYRCGMLEAELGDSGMGCTYRLCFATADPDPSPFEWTAVRATATPEEVRVFPEFGGSFLDAVLGSHDDYAEEMRESETHWIAPYSTYRIASPAQRETFQANTR